MTTTTTSDVPPPSGAHTLSTWEEWGGDYRLVWGADRPVPASDISLAPHHPTSALHPTLFNSVTAQSMTARPWNRPASRSKRSTTTAAAASTSASPRRAQGCQLLRSSRASAGHETGPRPAALASSLAVPWRNDTPEARIIRPVMNKPSQSIQAGRRHPSRRSSLVVTSDPGRPSKRDTR